MEARGVHGSEFSRTEVESSRAPADQFSSHRRNVANHNPAYYFTAMVVPWVVFASLSRVGLCNWTLSVTCTALLLPYAVAFTN